MTSTSARSLAHSLDKLRISHSAKAPPATARTPLAESWDDEAEDEDDTPTAETGLDPAIAGDTPEAPPPTPASPSVKLKATSSGSPYQTFPPYGMNGSEEADQAESNGTPPRSRGIDAAKRPEKTTATASRLIAAGIGQRPPRRTKEEREYDQAMRVQEKKRRDAEKEELERRRQAKERAKASIWED